MRLLASECIGNPYILEPDYDPFDVIRHIPQDAGDIPARTTYFIVKVACATPLLTTTTCTIPAMPPGTIQL